MTITSSTSSPSPHDELPAAYRLAVETILAEPMPDIDVNRLIPNTPIAVVERSTRRNWLLRIGGWSLVAAAALVAGAVVMNWNASLALAQVVEATTRHRNVRCKFETIAEVKFKWHSDRDEEFVSARSQEVTYFDLVSPRVRIERHEKTINDTVQAKWVTVQDNQQDRALVTSSIELVVDDKDTSDENLAALIRQVKGSGNLGKHARLFRITGGDELLQPFPYVKTDKTFLEILRAMQSRKEVLPMAVILDGRRAMKYELSENGKTTILWVDTETKLPVRIEQEVLDPHPNTKMKKWIYASFEWDVDIDDPNEFFSIKPPADYAFEDHSLDR